MAAWPNLSELAKMIIEPNLSQAQVKSFGGSLSSNLAISASPYDFFRSELKAAFSKQRLVVCEDVEFYLVNLLSSYVFEPPKSIEKPLALKFKDALEAPIEVRSSLFKNLGDSSLYLAGFFQDSFNRKIYDIDYFISMGETAYSQLSEEVRRSSSTSSHKQQTFKKLSAMFSDFVDSFATLSENFNVNSGNDLIANYERWNNFGSKRELEKFLKEGLHPVEFDTKKTQ